MFALALLAFVAPLAVAAQDCFAIGVDCFKCKAAGCGWCQIGQGADISEGCQPADRRLDCGAAATNRSTSFLWNGPCPDLSGEPATLVTGSTAAAGPGGNTNAAPSPGNGGAPSSTSSGPGGVPVPVSPGGSNNNNNNGVACDPTWPKCEKCGSGTASKKRAACEKTWGQVKEQLVGNNCRYEPGSAATAKWTDSMCVISEKACIPPRGSAEKPIYETCVNPKPCETQSPGWKCGACWLVQDDGGQQQLPPGVAPAPDTCTASRMALTVGVVTLLATLKM